MEYDRGILLVVGFSAWISRQRNETQVKRSNCLFASCVICNQPIFYFRYILLERKVKCGVNVMHIFGCIPFFLVLTEYIEYTKYSVNMYKSLCKRKMVEFNFWTLSEWWQFVTLSERHVPLPGWLLFSYHLLFYIHFALL